MTKLINQNEDLQNKSKYKEKSQLKRIEMKYIVMKINKFLSGSLEKLIGLWQN